MNTDKLIQEKFDALPLDIKEAIGRIPWKDRVKSIAKREGLDEEKSQALETETMLILYGFMPPDEYQSNIVREVNVDEETAERIVKEVTDEIFADIEKQYEMIEAVSHIAEPEKLAESKPQPAPAPAPAPNPSPIPAPAVPTPLPTVEHKPTEAELMPEVVPGQTAHEVPHVEAKKEPLVSTPTYVPPAPVEEGSKRPDLNLPKSDYPHGQDPYREAF